MSCRLPGTAADVSGFWDMLVTGRTAWTDGPGKRFNMKAFQGSRDGPRGTAMDPQHRLLLEIAYESFENAGITLEALWGSNTGVFVGQWCSDYQEIEARDVDAPPTYLVTGTGPAISSNRLSYFFNLHGPSFTLDTGCVGVVLKPLSAAIRDGDRIRGVIRGSAVTQDGRTPGISVPSTSAQKEAIFQAYRQANLEVFADYVEAHGTGTQVGDPIEARAIAEAFTAGRPVGSKLPIGSSKANVGHTESAAGLVGLVKAILMLEHGVIPPQANYLYPNPDIPLDEWQLRVNGSPSQPFLPNLSGDISGECRFGYGGTNAHVIVDGYTPPTWTSLQMHVKINGNRIHNSRDERLRVFFISAASERSCQKMCTRLAKYLVVRQRSPQDLDTLLINLAYTLQRQSIHPYRLAITARGVGDLVSQLLDASSQPIPRRERESKARIAFVFSGQGAQYAEMGRELLPSHPRFARSIDRARRALEQLGCQWDLISELCKPKTDSQINSPAISQPATTAIQLGLVDLLGEMGVIPDAVVGHSSGEIGAMYAAKAISFEDAIAASYYRGYFTSQLLSGDKLETPGGMMAVGADADAVNACIESLGEDFGQSRIACYNSPSSVTVSGDATAIDELKRILDQKGIFNRKLMTNGAAYHSHQMKLISNEYQQSLDKLTQECIHGKAARMFSSVTGKELTPGCVVNGDYWVSNLISPVLFSQAVQSMCAHEFRGHPIDTIVEIGPHSQLAGPVKQILKSMGSSLTAQPRYRKFWHETRISKEYRHRKHTPHPLLGSPCPDFIPLEPRWRRYLSLKDLPWLRGHIIQGQVIFPAAGFITMAIQAIRQHAMQRNRNASIKSVQLHNVSIGKALLLPEDGQDVEITFSLRPEARTSRASSTTWNEFRIFTVADNGEWTEHCRGNIRVNEDAIQAHAVNPSLEVQKSLEQTCNRGESPRKFYRMGRGLGLDWNSGFDNVTSIKTCQHAAIAVATESLLPELGGVGDILHPAGILLTANGVRTTKLMDDDVSAGPQEDASYGIEWVPFVNDWKPRQRDLACRSRAPPACIAKQNAYLDEMTFHYVQKTLREVDPTAVPIGYSEHFFEWMRSLDPFSSDTGEVPFPEKPHDLDLGPFGEAVVRLGPHLADIVTQTTDPLSLLVPDNLLTRVYTQDRFSRCIFQMADYCRALGLQNPGLKVLEVGGGTASATIEILQALNGSGDRLAEHYDFTDLSPGFFEGAKNRLGSLGDVVHFKVLDIEKAPAEQGFEEGEYDLIVASNVVHATQSIDKVVAHLRPLLRPGGTFLLMEITREMPHLNLLFGVFEGWWAAGFTDTAPKFVDYDSGSGGSISVFAATIPWTDATVIARPVFNIVSCDPTTSLAVEDLQHLLGTRVYLHSVTEPPLNTGVTIIMPEIAHALSSNPANGLWRGFKNWVLASQVLVFVSCGSPSRLSDTEAQIWVGVVRCLRAEMPQHRIITLDLPGLPHGQLTKALADVLPTFVSQGVLDPNIRETRVDFEFTYNDGQLYVPRAFNRNDITSALSRGAGRAATKLIPFLDERRPLAAKLAVPGLLESLRWVDDEQAPALGPDDIKLELRAASINFKDVLIAAGQLEGITDMRNDCSGVVVSVGENMRSRFRPGDRVCAMYSRPYANYPVVHGDCCHIIPDTMTFEDAAALPIVWCTAYYALVDQGRLKAGEKLLVHSAAGAVGQASIILAQHFGAEVFVTVGNDEKREFLRTEYGIPDSHIFSSRNSDFFHGIKRLTGGSGVDVVLNSLSGDMFRMSCNLVRPFGRFVEIGRKDIMEDALMPMAFLLNNITFSYVELNLLMETNKPLARRILGDVVNAVARGSIRPFKPKSIPISEIEAALRQFHDGKHIGKTVLSVSVGQQVKGVPPPPAPAKLDQGATYVVVGGLGGLGRPLISWMADHGARHIVALSRSAAADENRQFIQDLETKGVQLVIMRCDVADKESLRCMVQDVSNAGLPPIRGIIHSAMVLQDSLLEDMTVEQWGGALNSKIAGSRNLHEMFGEVDFFIMLSSVVTLRGNAGQSNYAAGCSYQDALARHRTTIGLPASAINIGPVLEVGFVSENAEIEASLRRQGFGVINLADFLQLINYAVAHPRPSSPSKSVFSIGELSSTNDMGVETGLDTRLFGHVCRRKVESILQQLSNLIATPVESLSQTRSLDSYGVDSLVAVELRNWIGRHLKASIPLLALRKGGSIWELAKTVTKESRLVSFAAAEV
ncbi:unnamed protein product [Parascedosporium putredinis]|uniref:Polyketide synthase n=1 Tax=Parascedosporium putredinis TaxID=1442378 RepID=A0A9P1GYL0_9PEZI|nr:unnamed protein product [Parascedosporium putredinis]CAI7990837.1 unnamed protein product [Parascedosporium putredinis]